MYLRNLLLLGVRSRLRGGPRYLHGMDLWIVRIVPPFGRNGWLKHDGQRFILLRISAKRITPTTGKSGLSPLACIALIVLP
jgi:hypothetical protein